MGWPLKLIQDIKKKSLWAFNIEKGCANFCFKLQKRSLYFFIQLANLSKVTSSTEVSGITCISSNQIQKSFEFLIGEINRNRCRQMYQTTIQSELPTQGTQTLQQNDK